MSDYISRQAVIDIATYECGKWKGLAKEITKQINALPSAQPKRGKWIERESGIEDKESGFETVIACSCCDFPATTFYSEDCESRTQIRTDFCPNCGADMRCSENPNS